MKMRLSIGDGALLIASVAAGALGPPPHPIATPLSGLAAGLICLLGLVAWRWSRLPSATKAGPPGGVGRIREAAWFGLGLLVGLFLLGVLRLGIEPSIPAIGARLAAAATLPIWRRLLIIYVAAVAEEILFRLLLLSLIAGLAARLLRLPDRTPSRSAIGAANGLAALAFALAHLPSWTAAGLLTPPLALAVLSLNGAAGIVLGQIFAHRGIGAAIWTHAGADCAMQPIGPLTG